jgi:hypothetical protein
MQTAVVCITQLKRRMFGPVLVEPIVQSHMHAACTIYIVGAGCVVMVASEAYTVPGQ